MFYSVDTLIGNLNLIQKIIFALINRSLVGTIDDARDVLIKYLGDKLYESVKMHIPGFKEPKYANTMEYAVCGSPIILKPTPDYFKTFPYERGIKGIFVNHNLDAYYYLLKEEYIDNIIK